MNEKFFLDYKELTTYLCIDLVLKFSHTFTPIQHYILKVQSSYDVIGEYIHSEVGVEEDVHRI